MSARESQHYNLIAALHDQLEDVETFERYRKEVAEHPDYAEIWDTLKSQAEESVAMIRARIKLHVNTG